VLKAFLDRCPPEKKKALERFLSEKERLRLEKIPSLDVEINPDRFQPGEILDKVHWSWFLPTLKTYPEEEQELFLSSLNPFAAKSLAKTLKISAKEEEISESARNYLRQVLLDSLIDQKHPPLAAEYLPRGPLRGLLSLSKKELVRLIDFLSLHDLAEELRQIVETKILKKIYSFLSDEEKKFLKAASAHKDPFTLGRLGLERWDGSEESLRALMHRRGLARFAVALSGQNPDFLWHICHQLDIGRGNALFKLCAKESPHSMRDKVLRQIEELL